MADSIDWRLAVATLCKRDAVLRSVIERVGTCTLAPEGEDFPSLAEAIIHQQLSLKAGATIVRRFIGLYPGASFPSPQQVLATADEVLRSAGISAQKASYLKDLAQKVADGTVDVDAFARLNDDEIVAQLTTVRGIGRWTAEMFLIFGLCRPDVLPVDDLGLQKAVRQQYGQAEGAMPERIKLLAECWRPYCTVASWYLWRSLELSSPRQ